MMLYVPEEHGEQPRSVVDEPDDEMKVPAGQAFLGTQAVAGFPSLSHVFSLHVKAGVSPPGQYCPALHFEQTGSDDDVLEVVCCVPAGHSESARQMDSFDPDVRVPTGQIAQLRSDAEVGETMA